MRTLTVREAAEHSGISAHALRYYERIGLLGPVARTPSGHRRYSVQDLERLQFLHCLREAGMPIRRMREYAAMAKEGRATLAARCELLADYHGELRARVDALSGAMGVVEAKIRRLSDAARASPDGG